MKNAAGSALSPAKKYNVTLKQVPVTNFIGVSRTSTARVSIEGRQSLILR
jgi:hypothetical protein